MSEQEMTVTEAVLWNMPLFDLKKLRSELEAMADSKIVRIEWEGEARALTKERLPLVEFVIGCREEDGTEEGGRYLAA